MFKKGIVGAFLFFSLLAPAGLIAESNATKVNNDTKAKVEKKVENNKDDAIKAAMALLEEMNLKQVYIKAVDGLTNRLISANSKFKKVAKEIKAFYNKYIGWDAMKEDLAKLYAKYYTADELRDIANFYKTKTGQKVLKTMGKLTYEGQLLTQKRLKPHLKELQAILDKAMEDNSKKETKKSDSKK